MLLTESICVGWTKLLSFVQLVRESPLDWCEVVWQRWSTWQLCLSASGIVLLWKKTGANQNNPVRFERKLERERASILNHTHTHTHCALFFSCHNCFFFTVLYHMSLQPSAIYTAKTDALKRSPAWRHWKSCVFSDDYLSQYVSQFLFLFPILS